MSQVVGIKSDPKEIPNRQPLSLSLSLSLSLVSKINQIWLSIDRRIMKKLRHLVLVLVYLNVTREKIYIQREIKNPLAS